MKHSSLGASKAYRWMNCPGSVRLEDQVPEQPSSIYAMEGTAAHMLAELCLTKCAYPETMLGMPITVEDRQGGTKKFIIDQQMSEAVKVYCVEIESWLTSNLGYGLSVEHRFDLNWLAKHGKVDRDMFGTNDASVYQAFGTLHVFDYKHGAGKRVEVENNPQFLYYALGAIGEGNPECFEEVRMTVVQPRCEHPDGPVRTWVTAPEYVLDWGRNVLLPAAVEACKPDAPCNPAEEWCHWCPAQAICPALHTSVQEACPFDVVTVEKETVLPCPQELTDAERSKVLAAADLIAKWAKGVKEYEILRQREGTGCKDWKLVAKQGNRKWRLEEAENLAVALGLEVEQVVKSKMLTPAQIEKVLKETGLKGKEVKEKVDPLCHRPESVALVSAADKRPALQQENPFSKAEE